MEHEQTKLHLDRKRSYKSINKGKIRVTQNSTGARKIYISNYKIGRYLPPLEVLKREVQDQIRRYGVVRGRIREYLRNAGLLHETFPARAVSAGAEVLGITYSPAKHSLEVHRKKGERAVRRMWNKDDSERCIRNPSKYSLPSVQEFKKRFPNEYKWIKCHGGMYSFLESFRPGLYDAINRRTIKENIDLTKLGEELKLRILQGPPLSYNSLSRSKDQRERRLFRYINLIRRNRNLSFEEIVSELTGISESDIHAIPIGARECGEIAEKFVRCYIAWASKISFDPLHLGLKERLSNGEAPKFDRESVRFTFDGNHKGYAYADGRLGRTAIEVKVESRKLSGSVLDDLIQRYGNWNLWNDINDPMDGAVLFLYQEPKFYISSLSALESAGLKVITAQDMQGAFSALMHRVTNSYKSELAWMQPRLNLEALMHTNKILSSEQGVLSLSTGGFRTHRHWYLDMLNSLIEIGELK